MKKLFTCLIFFFAASIISKAQPSVDITEYAIGFNGKVTDIANHGDDKLFVAEQTGFIRTVLPGGAVSQTPLLDISSKVNAKASQTFSEVGLLGFTFSPGFDTAGYVYVNYNDTTGNGNTVISRFSVTNNVADPNSEQILLRVYQPYENHKGGCLKFGADGYLYCAFGDGGFGGDPGNRAQNKDSLLGKILRIDVSGSGNYAIPPSNPFVGAAGADEVWAYGLRNPWKISFDRLTHDLWIADVGQQNWEEVNFQSASSTGGENYGWRCYEGNHIYNDSACGPSSDYVSPVLEYSQNLVGGCAVIGGYVYRGTQSANMYGRYFYSDFCSNAIYGLIPGSYVPFVSGVFPGKSFTTFGEDNNGELYIASLSTGSIYRISEKPNAVNEVADVLSQINVFPQPSNGKFTCAFSLLKQCRVALSITDLTGRELFKMVKNYEAGVVREEVSASLPAGLYLLHLQSEGSESTTRLSIGY